MYLYLLHAGLSCPHDPRDVPSMSQRLLVYCRLEKILAAGDNALHSGRNSARISTPMLAGRHGDLQSPVPCTAFRVVHCSYSMAMVGMGGSRKSGYTL